MLVLASNIEIRLYFICLSVAFEFINREHPKEIIIIV